MNRDEVCAGILQAAVVLFAAWWALNILVSVLVHVLAMVR